MAKPPRSETVPWGQPIRSVSDHPRSEGAGMTAEVPHAVMPVLDGDSSGARLHGTSGRLSRRPRWLWTSRRRTPQSIGGTRGTKQSVALPKSFQSDVTIEAVTPARPPSCPASTSPRPRSRALSSSSAGPGRTRRGGAGCRSSGVPEGRCAVVVFRVRASWATEKSPTGAARWSWAGAMAFGDRSGEGGVAERGWVASAPIGGVR